MDIGVGAFITLSSNHVVYIWEISDWVKSSHSLLCTSPISCHVYVDYGGWSFVSAMIMYDVYQTINSFYTEYCDKMHRMCGGRGGGYPHFCENGVFGIGAFSLKFAKNNVGIPSPKSVCVENLDWVVLLWHKYFILHIHRDAVKHICVSSVWTFLMYRHW